MRFEISNASAVYEDTEIHEHRQNTGPSQNTPGYPGTQSRGRERDDYDMDDYRPAPQPQRTLYQGTMPQDYAQNYPMTSAAFQNPSMTPAPEYVLTRGQATEVRGQVPRSEYETFPAAPAGRSATLQSPNQGQFAGQQSPQGLAPYHDPRPGQLNYPPNSAGRGFDPPPGRHAGPTDGRRR